MKIFDFLKKKPEIPEDKNIYSWNGRLLSHVHFISDLEQKIASAAIFAGMKYEITFTAEFNYISPTIVNYTVTGTNRQNKLFKEALKSGY